MKSRVDSAELIRSTSVRKFIQIAFSTLVVIATVQMIRNEVSPESWDKAMVLISGVVGLGIFFANKRVAKESGWQISLSVFVSFVLGILAIETHQAINGVDINRILWFGFGIFVLAFCFVLLPFIFTIMHSRPTGRSFRVILLVFAVLVTLIMIPAAWQGGATLMEPDSPEYVINELLAVSSGNTPYIDFIPQYGILYTWLLAPFTSFLNPDQLVTLGLYMMSLGGISAVLIGVWLVYKATNKQSLSLATLLVVPFTSIAQFPGRDSFSGSIYSTPTQIPVRLLVPIIAALFLLKSSNHNRYLYGGFILLGINLWLNTDFGAAASLSALLMVFLGLKKFKTFLSAIFYLLMGWLFYPLVLSIFGKDVEVNYFATFIRQFGGGFGAEPIQTPGPVLVILPLIVSLFFASSYPLYQERFAKVAIPDEYRRAILTATFFASWSLIGFAYYLNRSYASGQMQILFLPLAIAMASYFYYIIPKNKEDLPWTAKSFFAPATWKGKTLKRTLANLPIALVMTLPLATIIALPSPAIELERLTKAPAVNQWPLPKNEKAFSELPAILGTGNKEDFSYFGSSGNYVDIKYGVRGVNIFNSPFDLFMSQNMVDLGCKPIIELGSKFLILNDTALVVAQNFSNQELCGIYRFDPSLNPRVMIRK